MATTVYVALDGTVTRTETFDYDTEELVVDEGGTVTREPADPDRLASAKAADERRARRARLDQAAAVLGQWAEDARGTTVTNGNNTAVTQVLVDRLGIFFDRFADLLAER